DGPCADRGIALADALEMRLDDGACSQLARSETRGEASRGSFDQSAHRSLRSSSARRTPLPGSHVRVEPAHPRPAHRTLPDSAVGGLGLRTCAPDAASCAPMSGPFPAYSSVTGASFGHSMLSDRVSVFAA